MASSSDGQSLWYRIFGDDQASRISVANNTDIYSLKQQIKAQREGEGDESLKRTPIGNITIFKQEADKDDPAKALRAGSKISNIEHPYGTDDEHPLFVHYTAPQPAENQEAELREFRKQLVVEIGQQVTQRLHPIAEVVFGVVPDDERSAATRYEVAEACKNYHGNQCLILRGLPFTQGVAEYHSWSACTAHIYPKRQAAAAKKGLGFNVDDPKNTLRLTRHFEQQYDKGRLMLLPKPSDEDRQKVLQGEHLTVYKLEIHVEEGLREEVVKRLYYDRWGTKVDAGPLLVSDGSDGWRNLKFGELHEQSFVVARVWMRALYEKARMAYAEHKCLPNPDEPKNVEMFKCLCNSWQPFWAGRCFQEVGQSPAVMEVEHNERAARDIVEEDDNMLEDGKNMVEEGTDITPESKGDIQDSGRPSWAQVVKPC